MQISDFLPPVLTRSLKKIKRKFDSAPPKWQEVSSGHHKGYRLFIPDKGVNFKAMLNGSYDDFMWKWLNKTDFPDGSIILDIGGHIGFSALGFSRKVGANGQVLCFEPNPENIERIKLHLQKNEEVMGGEIKIFPFALASQEGEMPFSTSDQVDNQTSSGGYLEGVQTPLEESNYRDAGFSTRTVPVRILDKVLRGEGTSLDRIKLLKIDVEGAEGAVLQGAKELLSAAKPHLLIEVHSAQAMLEVNEVLIPLKYNIEILEKDGAARCFILASADR